MAALVFPGKSESLAPLGHPPSWGGGRLFEGGLPANALCIGDNLKFLHELAHDHGPIFHFVYADPPYNTGQNFTYSDAHSGGTDAWLRFLWPRLHLAHRVLTDDGLLFISIDDHECATLTLLLDEIFGRENRMGCLKWRRKRKPSWLSKGLVTTMEYILIYARNRSAAPPLLGPPKAEGTRPVLNQGNGVSERILRKGRPCFLPDGVYPPQSRGARTLNWTQGGPLEVRAQVSLCDVPLAGRFRVGQDTLDQTLFVTRLWGLRRTLLMEEMGLRTAQDHNENWPSNEDAAEEILQDFGFRAFDYAKPIGLLQNLIQMIPLMGGQDLRCLDIFAGTGTLALAAFAQNQVDGRQRTVYLLQSEEPCVGGPRMGFQTVADLLCHRLKVRGHLHKMTRITTPSGPTQGPGHGASQDGSHI